MFLRRRKSIGKGNVEEPLPEQQLTPDAAPGRPSAARDIAPVGGMSPAREVVSVRRGESSLAELDGAIESGSVGLEHIVVARYLSQDATNPYGSVSERAEYASRVANLSSIYFARQDWGVADRLFCTYIPAAVVLKGAPIFRGREVGRFSIEVVYLPEASRTTHPLIEEGLWKARRYYLEADQCRSAPRYNSIVRDVFTLIVNLLSLADAEAMKGYDPGRTARALPKIEEEFRRVEAVIDRALLIEARQVYLAGMFMGALALGGGVLLIRYLVSVFSQVDIDTLGLGVVIAGGAGAILSVMTRLTANNLSVDPGVGSRLILLAGSFRPLIGGLFAFALYVFVQGGLLPIEVTATGVEATYFYLGVAFLAGFSERFAQDAVTRAGSVIADTTRPNDQQVLSDRPTQRL